MALVLFAPACGEEDETFPPVRYLEVYINDPCGGYACSNPHPLAGTVTTEEAYSYDACPVGVTNTGTVVTWTNTSTGATGSVNPYWDRRCEIIWWLGIEFCSCYQTWSGGFVSVISGQNGFTATAVRGELTSTATRTLLY